MYELYPDQTELVDSTRESLRQHRFTLMCSATGSGKTAMALFMIDAALRKGKRMVFTVPRRPLMEQTSETFSRMGIPHSFIAAGKPFNPHAKLHIGMIDSMAKRVGELPPCDFAVFDETHFGDSALDTVIQHYRSAGSYGLGLSATPWKLNGKGMGCWYDNMVEGKSIRWLMDNNRLSDFEYLRGTVTADASTLKKRNGDYAKKDLQDLMDSMSSRIIGDVVEQYQKHCMGNLHIVRCVSVKDSQLTAEAFRDKGIPWVHVDGNTPDNEKARIFRAYAKRELLGLSFCDLLNFGFDLEQASGGIKVCIESGSDLKPSESLAGQMQFWGRMLRYKPKPAVIIDHVEAWRKHQYPDTERDWTLEDREEATGAKKEKVDMIRRCMSCYFPHRPAPQCPMCGQVYTVKSREVEKVGGDMVPVTKEELEAARKQLVQKRKNEQSRARSREELVSLGKSRNMENPEAWANHILRARSIGR